MLDAEHRAGAAEAGLDLVADEDDAVVGADLPQPLEVLRRGSDEAALTQHRLDDDRRHLVGLDVFHEGLVEQLGAAARRSPGRCR